MNTLFSLRFLPLYASLLLAIVAGSVFGSIDLDIAKLTSSLFWSDQIDNHNSLSSKLAFQKTVLFELRLPRVLLGMTVGIALGMSGACFQALFKNPLADPGIVGVSAGAATGAIAFIVLGTDAISFLAPFSVSSLSLPLFAMLGALFATTLLFALSQRSLFFWLPLKANKSRSASMNMSTATLLLAGIAINALFSSINGALIFFSDEQQLRELTFWSLGSLTRADNSFTLPVVLFVLLCAAINFRFAKAINAFSLGDNQAYFMGYNVTRIKGGLLILNTCAIGAVVALSGIIGFVGLVIPHIARMLFGANNRWVLPASALLGATALLLADLVARTVVDPAEMPIGVITGLIGSPFFIWLLVRSDFK